MAGRTEERGSADSGGIGPALRAALLSVAADDAVARQLTEFLSDAGVTMEARDAAGPLDGLVVLMSACALRDPTWIGASESVISDRIIPVCLGAVVAGDVPQRLAELNWIDWDSQRPTTTCGHVLVGLFANPDRVRMSRQLTREAEAWDQALRPPELLIAEYGRAREMSDMLAVLDADAMARPKPVAADYVEASLRASRRARRHRRGWRGAAATAALAATITALLTLPQIAARSRNSMASLVTAGNDAIIESTPEWAAANASALMLEGTKAERDLGRATLIQALEARWAVSEPGHIDSVRAMVPMHGGRRGAVVALTKDASAFAVLDVQAARTTWSIGLPHVFEQVDVDPDGRMAVVAGAGAGTIDLRSRRFRLLVARKARGAYVGTRATSGSQIVLWTASGSLETVDSTNARRRVVGRYKAVLDVAAGPDGGAVALVSTSTDSVAIVNALSGGIRARARIEGAGSVGALSPGRRDAIVAAEDGQFWTFGDTRRTRPTGITVPVSLKDVQWARGERLVIASESERGQVVLLPRGERLGHVCWAAPAVQRVRLDPGHSTIACTGYIPAFWRLPPGPRTAPRANESTATRAAGRIASLETRGSRARITFREPGAGTTPWFAPVHGAITGVTFAADGRDAIIGSAKGQVAIVGLTARTARVLVEWHVPGFTPVTAVGWGRGPFVRTASGQVWDVPECRGCMTDQGLIAAAAARFSGCFTERQLSFISTGAQRALGLRMCPPVAPLPGA